MLQILTSLARFVRLFRRRDGGGPTVEFAIMFMPFIIIPVSAFELGLLMTRHVMLERGLDITVRTVRLNTGAAIEPDEFKQRVCDAAGILPNCMVNLQIEMRPVKLRTTAGTPQTLIPSVAECANLDEPYKDPRNFDAGVPNELMIVRACGLMEPMLPDFGLGYFLSRMRVEKDGRYPLVSVSAFVMEPL